jgi:hypothetical protein
MGQEARRRQRRIPCLLKIRLQYRGRYPTDPEFVLPNWYRDFELADKTTLEQLAEMILQILGWAEDHLYEFRINGRSYVSFGDNADYIVDAKDACVLCAVPMHLIDLSRGDVFEFIFDFGELYTFRLTVTAIYPFTAKHPATPRVLSYCGKNILQYPWLLSRPGAARAPPD